MRQNVYNYARPDHDDRRSRGQRQMVQTSRQVREQATLDNLPSDEEGRQQRKQGSPDQDDTQLFANPLESIDF